MNQHDPLQQQIREAERAAQRGEHRNASEYPLYKVARWFGQGNYIEQLDGTYSAVCPICQSNTVMITARNAHVAQINCVSCHEVDILKRLGKTVGDLLDYSVTPIDKRSRKSQGRQAAKVREENVILSHEDKTYSNEELCRGEACDEGNAQVVNLLFGNLFCYTEAYGWMAYNGRYWERDGAEAQLHRKIVEALQKRRAAAVHLNNEYIIRSAKPSAGNVRAAKFMFQSMVTKSIDEFDANPDALNVTNGVIDLSTGEIEPHSPAQIYTYCIDVEYEPNIIPGEWLSFLRGVIDGKDESERAEMLDYLRRAVGYSLTGHTSEEVMWYVYGPSRSGKGTFTETIMALLRHPLATEVDFATFSRERDNDANNFDLAPLKPARCVFASESNRHQRLNTAKIKALTGGNMINCAFKRKDHFTYRPQFKVWLSSNHPVNADVDDDAAWGRLRVVQFPNSNLGKEDKGLKHRLKTKDNLKGVLAWAVQGAIEWYQHRGEGLPTPQRVVDATNEARTEMDTVGQWLDECVEITGRLENGYMPAIINKDLYQSYHGWCEDNGVAPKKQKGFTQSLNRRGVDGPVMSRVESKPARRWFGLQFL